MMMKSYGAGTLWATLLLVLGLGLAQDQDDPMKGGQSPSQSQSEVAHEAQLSEATQADLEALRSGLQNLEESIESVRRLDAISSSEVKFIDVSNALQEETVEAADEADSAAASDGADGQESGASANQDASAEGAEVAGGGAVGVQSVADLADRNQELIAELQSVVEENEPLVELLRSRNIPIENVVLVKTAEDGSLSVYYEQLEPPETEALPETQPQTIPTPEGEPETDAEDEAGDAAGGAEDSE